MKKRRFAFGGFSDIDEGRDTPDQALARKASMSPMAASDKAAGLASTKGQDVGLKRFFMGNIDAPDSEASRRFGAGKGSSDRMAQAADQNLPVQSQVRPPFRPSPGSLPSFDDFKRDNTPIDMAESPMLRAGTPTGPSGYKRDTAREDALTLDRESVRKTPLAKPKLKRRPVKPDYEAALKSVAKGKATPNPRDAELGMSRGMRKNPLDDQPLKKGGSIKAYASGGSVSSRADGCAQRGKTKGMMR
jgi:hypothetical protein